MKYSASDRGCQVRSRLRAGGRRIRTSGPALAKGSVGVIEGRCRTDRPGWRSLSAGALARRRWSGAGGLPTAVPLTAGPKVRIQLPPAVSPLRTDDFRFRKGETGDGEHDVVGNVGEGAQDVRRAAGANGSPGAKFNSMSPHSSSSVEPRSRAQRVPGGVFKKYDVEAVVVADIPRTLGRVGTIRRRDRANVYLLNPHFVLANISKEQWQCFASLQSRCQN